MLQTKHSALFDTHRTRGFRAQRKFNEGMYVFIGKVEIFLHSRCVVFLQELKAIKSNLRSKAIYSPVEMRWEEICKNYLESPTLPVTSWKCRLPVFV